MAVRVNTDTLDRLLPYVEKAVDTTAFLSTTNEGDIVGTVQNAVKNYLRDLDDKTMRGQREMNPWANAAIMNRRDEVQDARVIIKTRSGEQMSDEQQAIADEMMLLFEGANQQPENMGLGGAAGPAVDDALTINRGVMQILEYDDARPRGLKFLDGALLKEKPGWKVPEDGSTSTQARYEYRPADRPREAPPVEFLDREIIVLAPYALSYDEHGLAPMRALKRVLQAELDVFTWMHTTQQQGSPGGIFIMPGAAPGTPDRMKNLYELKIAGKAGYGFMNLPADSRFIELGSINLLQQGTFTFYEILMKATAISFRTTPFHLGWDTSNSLSSSSDAQMEMQDRGIFSLLRFLAGVWNRRIVPLYGEAAVDLRVSYEDIEAEQEITPGPELRAIAKGVGFATINDLKVRAGLKPYTLDDVKEMLAECKITDISAEEIWPYFNQEYVPAMSGKAIIDLPVVYAFKANKSAADASNAPDSAPPDSPSVAPGAVQVTEVPPSTPVVPSAAQKAITDKYYGGDDEHVENAVRELAAMDEMFAERLRALKAEPGSGDKDDPLIDLEE